MTAPASLGSAAQAIASAFNERYELCGPFDDSWQELCLASALCAAAKQMSCYHSKKFLYSIADAMKLMAIADELENQS